jgi:transglutaminase-like putative cysteine protease
MNGSLPARPGGCLAGERFSGAARRPHPGGFTATSESGYRPYQVLRLLSGGPPCPSGYLHAGNDAKPGDVVSGESHAWVEAWLGDWWPFDPTNEVAVGEHHAVVGRGWDYGDVPPLTLEGVHSAGTPDRLEVEVEVTISRVA